ncbi:MAG: hypothetical protein O2904_02240 [bacterium]|nr:hypothetical protein [bacterium]
MDPTQVKSLVKKSWLLQEDQKKSWLEKLETMSADRIDQLGEILEEGEQIDKEAEVIAVESFAERTGVLVDHVNTMLTK